MEIRPILSSLRRHKITAFLLVLEIALTCAIVCNAVFLISQRLERMHMPSGIAEHELIQIQLANLGLRADAKARTLEDLAALRQIAGVTEVGLASQLPFGNASSNNDMRLDPTQKLATLNAAMYTGQNLLQTMGTQLVAGRNLRDDDFRDDDEVNKAAASGNAIGQAFPQVLVITQAMAERLWPGENALGRQLYLGKTPLTVVGVVAHLVRPNNFSQGTENSIVVPIAMKAGDGSNYLIRTASQDRERVLKAALAKLKALDPKRVILQKRTWDEVRHEFFQDDRAMTGILAGVCLALLVVTALGIVGLGSFWVAQRRRMIGVRRALGATRANILHYFQTENFLLATIGIALGMVLAYGINLFLMLHYELPRLPAIYLPVGALLLWLLGQLAVLGPALRAAAVPPVVATRSV
ncbi:MAG TPA: FtsX-like permease family protein [Rhodanobacter sp.]|jgi:putative ABC transport system permease protein|nr:FtsX-like permease family protein [Rhodanobacter sp.]